MPDMIADGKIHGDSLGERIRERRRALKLTLKEIADAAGLSIGFISQVERGLTAPSLSSLASLAQVLDTPITSFLSKPQQNYASSVTRKGERSELNIANQALSYERISSTFPGQKIHSVIFHLPQGYQSETTSHEGEDMLFVLDGTVTSFHGDKIEQLKPGDSAHYSALNKHSIRNDGSDSATVLWVGTMDLFGDVK